MKHEYLETLMKIKQMEDKLGGRTVSVNELVADKLKKEDPNYNYTPKYVARVRNDLRKLRRIKVGDLTGLEHLEKNLDDNIWMQSKDVEKFITDYRNSKKQQELLKRQQIQLEDLSKQQEELKRKQEEFEKQKIKQQEEFEKQKEDFKKQLDELNRQKELENKRQKEKEAEEKKIKDAEEKKKKELSLKQQFLREKKLGIKDELTELI